MPDEPARVSVPILKVIELSGQPLDQIEFQLEPGACRITKLPDRVWLFGGLKLGRQKILTCDKRLHAVFGRVA